MELFCGLSFAGKSIKWLPKALFAIFVWIFLRIWLAGRILNDKWACLLSKENFFQQKSMKKVLHSWKNVPPRKTIKWLGPIKKTPPAWKFNKTREKGLFVISTFLNIPNLITIRSGLHRTRTIILTNLHFKFNANGRNAKSAKKFFTFLKKLFLNQKGNLPNTNSIQQ